jgi:hypothetical protein
MLFDDWLIRQVREAATAVANALKHRSEGELEHALEAIEEAYALLLGPNRSFLDTLDSATLARLLDGTPRIRELAHACRVEADILDELGDHAGAARRRHRAGELDALSPPG